MSIPKRSSELPTIDGVSKNWPNRNVEIAKGTVSNIGALELMLPSLLCPRRLFTKDPTESPNIHPKPRTRPIMNAELVSVPK